MMKTCAIIPAYNESRTISDVVSGAKRFVECVLVVDDGSADKTGDIAESAGAAVLRHAENQGKGAALRDGFQWAGEKNFDAVIILDGDGQHDTEEIPKFLKAAENPEIQLIVGNRMGDVSRMPLVRQLTNRFMSFILSVLIGQRVPDSQNGYRLLKLKFLKDLKFSTANFEIESEMLVRACERGAKIASVPVKTIYAGEVSFINPVVDTCRFFRLVFKNLRCLPR